MGSSYPTIRQVAVTAYTIPTDKPESDGTIEWNDTTLVLVDLKCGDIAALGYSYADSSAAFLAAHKLASQIVGQDPMAVPFIVSKLERSVRNAGRPGIASTAIAAIEAALWDLKARLLDVPLATLLGAYRREVVAYGSGGFTSYSIETLQEQLGNWSAQGFSAVKMKIGTHPDRDPERVKAARAAIGNTCELFVDANGAYMRKQAIAMAETFAGQGVTWFEEPVTSDDLDGLCEISRRAPAGMRIAAGEYGYDITYFRRMVNRPSVDVLQSDATRCGVTAFLEAAALCDAAHIPFSAHTSPSLHVHLCCAAPNCMNLEYFHDHDRIEHMLFDGAPKPKDGMLSPDFASPGLGLDFKREDAAKFLVFAREATK
jgi:L-alanine-DL-glutamate epimerase-like enolase superfamily enzyme